MIDKSLFVSDDVHERVVELADGTKHTLYFKELPAVEFRKHYNAEQSSDENVRAGAMARLIAACLCEQDGKPAVTYQQALKLKSSAANAIARAVLDVNGMGAKQGNVSSPAESDGSGTS